MKKVLVTGGCGFIGSWCCSYYRSKGWKVVAYDNLTKYELTRTGYDVAKARSYNLEYLKKLGVLCVKEDIRDKKRLRAQARGCDFIIHTAAQPAVTISMEDPQLDFTTNVMGTLNVLDMAKEYGIPVVNCATIHVYGNTINTELKENRTRYLRRPAGISERYPLLGGNLTPLHASKVSADAYTKVYIDTYGIKAASFRLTGLYGQRQFGGEDHGWVANFSIRACLDLPINIYGTGKQVRDILYAQDLVEAFDAFYRNPVPGIYNIGGGSKTAISLRECVEVIEDLLHKKVKVTYCPERFGDLRYFVCDTRKASSILGWQARTTPRQGIRQLIQWIQENKKIFKTI